MQEAVQLIHSACRVFATSHIDPDGDAFGSLLGFAHTLRRLGKTVTVALADPVAWRFQNLPGVEDIQNTGPAPDDDLLVSLDASDPGRIEAILPKQAIGNRPLLMIDHHVTNTRFGTVNILDTQAASTCEIVYDLSLALGAPPDQPTATCLLTGVVTDTLGFRTTNTTPRCLDVAQALMKAGANLADICLRHFSSDSFDRMRLTADALHRMQLSDGILWTEVSQADLRRLHVPYSESAGIVTYLSTVREAKIAVVFRERDDGRIDISLRSKPGINVAQTALALGGGGHPQAAGATLAPPMAVVRDKVLQELRALLRVAGSVMET